MVQGPKGRVQGPVRGRPQARLRAGAGGRRHIRRGTRFRPLNRRKNHTVAVVVDRLTVRPADRDPVERFRRDGSQGGGRGGRGDAHDPVRRAESVLFSERFSCPKCGLSLPELEPRQFSFNSPFGVCPDCHGLGTQREVSADMVLGRSRASRSWKGSCSPGVSRTATSGGSSSRRWRRRSRSIRPRPGGSFPNGPAARCCTASRDGRSNSRRQGEVVRERVGGHSRERAAALPRDLERRRAVFAGGIHGGAAVPFVWRQAAQGREPGRSRGGAATSATWPTVDRPGSGVLRSDCRCGDNGRPGVGRRHCRADSQGGRATGCDSCRNVGLEYLTLGRSAGSLSGGEAQRIRLATQIGSRLVGVLYILDEPSIGLHQRDNQRLLGHADGTARPGQHGDRGGTRRRNHPHAADHVIDLGPRAGRFGGEVVAEGTVEEVLSHPTSLTARYLRKRTAHTRAAGPPAAGRPSVASG